MAIFQRRPPPLTGRRMEGGVKNTIFDQYLDLSQKLCKIEPYTIKGKQESASKLSNATILNNIEWPLTEIQDHDIIQRQITQKRHKRELYNGGPIESRINRTEPFSKTLRLEQPLTKFSRSHYSLTLTVS